MSEIILLITGMMIVTYSVRLLPFLIHNKIKFSNKISDALEYIPYIALGALIFPGIFSSVSGSKTGIIIVIAFVTLYSWFKKGLIFPVVSSILIIVLNKFITEFI